jgi:hypothetical protein
MMARDFTNSVHISLFFDHDFVGDGMVGGWHEYHCSICDETYSVRMSGSHESGVESKTLDHLKSEHYDEIRSVIREFIPIREWAQ